MSNQTIFLISSLSLTIALMSLTAIRSAGAQDRPRPQVTQHPPQRQDARDKKRDKRQSAQADEQIVDKDVKIVLETDMVLLDVKVVDQNNTPIMDLKKEDFSVYEDRFKQAIEYVSRQEVPVSF